MKRFIKKVISLLLASVIGISLFYGLLCIMGGNITGLAAEAFYAREKAQKMNDCTIVYLGDSVCKQLWDEYDEDEDGICHIGCNQAITPAGSYLLLREYLENNPQTEQAYYIVRPQTLANDIGLQFSYQYFVIPFLDEDNFELLEEETQEIIYSKFGKKFVRSKLIKTLLLNNNALMQKYLNYVQSQSETINTHRMSRTTVVYLKKMRELCKQNNVELIVRACPLSDAKDNQDWDDFENDITIYGFEDLLGGFIEDITYYPEDWFRDGTHFTKEILQEYGESIRKSVLEK